MSVLERHNVQIAGAGDTMMVFAHGFGCDQNMWRFVAPAFEDRYRMVLFDHVGAGGSDLAPTTPKNTPAWRATPTTWSRSAGSWARRGVFVGPLRQRHDRRPGRRKAPDAVRGPGSGRPVAPLHRRRRLHRRLQRGAESTSCSTSWRATTWAGRSHGAGDHGQSRSSGARRGTDQQLLPHRPGDRQAVRPRHLPVGQPRGSRRRGTPALILQCSDDIIAPQAWASMCTSMLPTAGWW